MTGDSLAITDRIKAPNPVRVLIGVLIPIIILRLPPNPDPDRHFYLNYIIQVWVGLSIAACLFILINALRKEGQLQWGTDSLIIRKSASPRKGLRPFT